MATKTKFLELLKPELLDAYSDFIPDIFSDNMDKIDEAIGLKGTLEITVDTDTKKVYMPINSGRNHVSSVVMTLRIMNNDLESVDDVVLPEVRLRSLLYRGSLYAVLESDENIPQGVYY
ncbi:MAG: hypothetical protein K2F81_04790, partial [Ruminococcus sp.]|nr:hypothetical protein [Ruminococcus sp.]